MKNEWRVLAVVFVLVAGEAHFDLALALEKLGRTREAIDQYRQTLKLRPDYTPARTALARLGAGQ
jgi:Flp pilus assembly protein TadD